MWIPSFVEKEVRKKLQEEFDQKIHEAQRMTDKIVELERKKRTDAEDRITLIKSSLWPLVLDKTELLTSKMALDLAKITNLPEYQSMREYLLGTVITIYDKASLEGQTDANMLCQFAKYVKSLVAELDRMKTVKKEEITPEPEYGE